MGRLPWNNGTMLAPMEGVTHPELRTIFAELGGVGVVCTEFVRISSSPVTRKNLLKEVIKSPGVPLSVQVMGNDPAKMAEAAGWVAEAGADAIDINLGCPAPRAVRGGVGSAMLSNPKLLFEVLVAMRAAVPGVLSAKIRAGFDTKDHVLEIGQLVEAAGADYIVVHPRRRVDFFEGVADWRPIALLKDKLRIPVVGNGDCWYATDALRMESETGCDGVMIGRPALRNPWIFAQIEALRAGRPPFRPSGRDLFEHLVMVVRRYRTAFPKARRGPVGKIKELLTYWGRAVDDEQAFRRAVLRLPELDAIVEFAETTLKPLPASRLDLDAHGTVGLEQSGRC